MYKKHKPFTKTQCRSNLHGCFWTASTILSIHSALSVSSIGVKMSTRYFVASLKKFKQKQKKTKTKNKTNQIKLSTIKMLHLRATEWTSWRFLDLAVIHRISQCKAATFWILWKDSATFSIILSTEGTCMKRANPIPGLSQYPKLNYWF